MFSGLQCVCHLPALQFYTMNEASKDDSVYEQMLATQRAHEATKNGGAAPAPKGAAMV